MRRKKYSLRAGGSFSEMIGPVTADVFRTAMPDGSMLLIDGDGRGIAVKCAEGTACLTQPSDPEDHILRSGESFIIDRKGLVAVTALTNTRINISMGISNLNSGTGQAYLSDANEYDGTIIDTPF